MTNHKSIFIFGYGYTAASLARLLQERGWNIAATSRNLVKRQELERLGITAYDFPDSRIIEVLPEYSHLLISIPPSQQGDLVLEHYQNAIRSQQWQWIGLLSSTGVYGDHQGAWVDENTPLPLSAKAPIQSRIDAERSWQKLVKQYHLPVHIFRLAGIYGPGKGIGVKSIATQAIVKEGQYFSRIHVEDIAHALTASMAQPSPGAVYNLCDDEPAPKHEVAEFAAGLLSLPKPSRIPFEEAGLSGIAAEFWQSNKRVSNRHLKEELAYSLHYPTYREGLAAIYSEEKE